MDTTEHLTCIDQKPGESLNRDTLLAALHDIFYKLLPLYGYTVREKQVELAAHILEVAGRRGITLAESEVGTGKTHAYLIAALLVKRGRLTDSWLRGHYPRQSWAESGYMPVVISTSSIALQNAILQDYIPALSQMLLRHGLIATPLTAVLRKGKEHYICEQRLNRFYATTDEHTKTLLVPFVGVTAPFDLAGADRLSPYIKRRICVAGRCGESCPSIKNCRFLRHQREVNDHKVDFQITNHHYFLADVLHRAGGKRPLLPHYQLVVIDEAHKFLQAARSMYGLELSSLELPELAQEVHTFTQGKSQGGVNVHRLAKRLSEQSGKLFAVLGGNLPHDESEDEAERFPAVMDSDTAHKLKALAGIADDLALAVTDSPVQKLYRERRARTLRQLGIMGERVRALQQRSTHIHWLEKRVEGACRFDVLCAIPKDLNTRLYRDIWGNGVPVVLTSGTLSSGGDFTRTRAILGLDKLPSHKLFSITMPSPFDHKNNTLLYISQRTLFPDNRDSRYISAVADEIKRLIAAAHGHAALLFTSYQVMGQIYALLKRQGLPFPLFRLERGGVHAIRRFRESKNGVLLASGSFWEGIDLPGDALSLLVIVKLPFAVPDPISDYERSLCADIQSYKAQCVMPDMLVKLKQGFGRLIRSETDTGVVAILDSRVNERGAYRSRVLAALPDCTVTAELSAVSQFLRKKKSSAYFL